jgi:nicotinamide-nucleotide amidase
MAKGVAMIADADIGIGVTGIAGPTGGTVDKKVGLIYVSVYYHDSLKVYRLELYDDMSRDERRKKTAVFVYSSLFYLKSYLK